MKVSDIGEFALIDLVRKTIENGQNRDTKSRRRVVTAIGDDAAVWRSQDGLTIATTDTMVEHVHFERRWSSFEDLGWKALAISLSDIAAMGGTPQYCLISLSMTAATRVEEIVALYRGMLKLANAHGVALVGGNIARASEMAISTTVLGSATGGGVLRRSTAKPGDVIALTGYTGLASAGLRMLRQQPAAARRRTGGILRQAFLRPQPRLAEARALLEYGVRTAIDISDGLLADLWHICQSSGLTAVVETDRVPLHRSLKRMFPGDALLLALTGGEDYELLLTSRPDAIERARQQITVPLSVIGRVESGTTDISVINSDGRSLSIAGKGWDHFKGP